jgi:hypothetical protein
MSQPEEETTQAEASSDGNAEGDAESTEPGTPPIDEDVAGSVNAALPDADE